ncbi:DUF4342 domain-containing protein [Helicovermis profundi]|uniref:DUF4342 domain-containing protein n=1 Tax=Helicovermis profundi TaxID=3065157 RepID=A0AAU9E4K1_9FIRM|nr:DUF4342 domain-containing protein [Clostridia bacterium S502]
MNITLEKIDLLKERANVSYTEAKDALEHTDGDIVEALIYLEKDDKIRNSRFSKKSKNDNYYHEKKGKDFIESFKKNIKSIHECNFFIRKKSRTYLNIPLSFAILFGIFLIPYSLVFLAFTFVFGFKLEIRKGEKKYSFRSNDNNNEDINESEKVDINKKN